MVVLRVGHVDEQRLVRVAQAVAVGVGLGNAHRPRELHRVVDELLLRLPVRPGVVGGGEHRAVRKHGAVCAGDHVVSGRPAKKRVEAVEQLVVVVHAVLVGVPHARIGADVAGGGHAQFAVHGRLRGKSVRGKQDPVSRFVVVGASRRVAVRPPVLRALGHGVPRLRGTREVAQLIVAEALGLPGGDAGEALRAGGRVERRAVPGLHRQEAHVLARAGDAARQVAAHERRLGVVIAEVAEGLHEVLLEVLEPVVVEIEVSHGAGARIGLPVRRHRVADDGRAPARPERAVHAGRDVGAGRGVRADDVVVAVDGRDLACGERDGGAVLRAARTGHARREHGAGELALPRVGQEVEVGVDRTRVEAAAAYAAGAVVRRVAVDEGELVGSAVLRRQPRHRMGPAPGGAFFTVGDAVAVGVLVVRVGREELVVPATARAGMVLEDGGRAAAVDGGLVCIAAVRARVFAQEVQPVAVAVAIRGVGAVVRVCAHVELPAVGNAVLVGVGAVVRAGVRGDGHGRSAAVGAGPRNGVRRRREGRVRIRGTAPEDVGQGGLLGLDVADVLRRRAKARLVAVLQRQVFVAAVVGLRVDGRARSAQVPCRGEGRLPAPGHQAVAVPVPARAGVEPELVVDLVVHEQQRLVERDRRDHPLGKVHLGGVKRQGAGFPVAARLGHARGIVVGIVVHRDRLHARRVLLAEHDRRKQVRAARQGRFDERPVERRPDVGPVLVEGVDDAVRHRHDGVGRLRRVGGHEVAVLVLLGVRRRPERVHPAHHLPQVAHAVAVGVPVDGIGAHRKLLEVGEAVVVRVARRHVPVRLLGGVEGVHDFLRGDLDALRNVVQVEPGAGHLHPVRAVHPADGGPIPEVVLVAVWEAVAVGVPLRRVGSVLRNPAVVLHERGPEVACPRSVRLRVFDFAGGGVRLEMRPGVRRAEVPERHGVRLGLGKGRIGHPLATDEDVHAVVGLAVVQSFVETADLPARRERYAERRPAVGRRRKSSLEGVRGQIVTVFIVVVGVERHVAALLGISAGDLEQPVAAAPDRHHGVDVRNQVAVEVAKVVRGEVLLREDRVEDRVGIERGVLLLLWKRRDLLGVAVGPVCRGEFQKGRREARPLLASRLQPGVEEAVPARIGRVVVSGRGMPAVPRHGVVRARRERAVVDGSRAVAMRVGDGGGNGRRIRVDVREVVERLDGAVRPHAALANVALPRPLDREIAAAARPRAARRDQ